MSIPAEAPPINVRSQSYWVARTDALCARCRATTRLLALVLPPGHEFLAQGETESADEWQKAERAAFIFHVEYLDLAARSRIQAISPNLRMANSATSHHAYWANHCEHCGALQDDEELHCEPGAFLPMSASDAARIRLTPVADAITASSAGYSDQPEFFNSIRKE